MVKSTNIHVYKPARIYIEIYRELRPYIMSPVHIPLKHT